MDYLKDVLVLIPAMVWLVFQFPVGFKIADWVNDRTGDRLGFLAYLLYLLVVGAGGSVLILKLMPGDLYERLIVPMMTPTVC